MFDYSELVKASISCSFKENFLGCLIFNKTEVRVTLKENMIVKHN